MYGLIGSFRAKPGEAEQLASILVEGTAEMPGCLSYIVAVDSEDPDVVWVTEVWETEERHRASLALPSVRRAIERGRPLIADPLSRTVTRAVGGHGLAG